MKKLSFAIIGGGPAGFYIGKNLTKLLQKPIVDIYEKQYCPFGLIRYGVAPDHISIKKAQVTLSQINTYKNFNYYGNQQITNDLLRQLKTQYSGIIYAIGAQDNHEPQWFKKALRDKTNNSKYIINARQIVYWYNNHPKYENYHIDLSDKKNIVIIGNGNVSIDISRIFLKNHSDLVQTQISQNALTSLQQNSIKNIFIIGRRGFTHSAFALKEIRQLHKLGIKIYCIWQQLQGSMNPSSYIQCTSIGDHNGATVRMNKRKLEFIKSKCQIIKMEELNKILQNNEKKVILRYLLDPLQISNNQIKLSITKLKGEPFKQIAYKTDKQQVIKFDILINSTGFKVEPISKQLYDEKNNRIRNSNGCVIKPQQQQKIEIGSYAVGWSKNGPKGVIDQTLLSCQQTFNNIRIHVQNKLLQQKEGPTFKQKNNINFNKYLQLKQIQLSLGDKQRYIKKKMKIKQVKQFFGVQ